MCLIYLKITINYYKLLKWSLLIVVPCISIIILTIIKIKIILKLKITTTIIIISSSLLCYYYLVGC